MKHLFFIAALICIASFAATLSLAADDEFDKLIIKRKKPAYREATPERSYQDDDTADTPPPKPQRAKKPARQEAPEPQQRVESAGISKSGDGYVVTLLGCQRTGNKLECNISIANNSKHNSFGLYSNCTAADNFGNTYSSLDSYSIGGEPNGTHHKVLSGMSANGSFSLTVTPNARSLSKLVFRIYSQNSSNMDFEINNVGL